MSIYSKLSALLTAANNKTGEMDATLTDAVQTLVDGYEQGGGGDTDPDHWVRPSGWPSYDGVQFDGTDVIYMTYDTTDPEYSFISVGSTGSDGSAVNLDIGTITNGVFTAIESYSYPNQSGFYRYLYNAGYPDYVVCRITPQSGRKITVIPSVNNRLTAARSNQRHQSCLEIYAHLHNLSGEANPGFRYLYNVRAVYLDVVSAKNGLSRTLSDLISLESAHVVSTNAMYAYYLFENDRNLRFVTLDMELTGNCAGIFNGCRSLKTLDTSEWGDMSSVTDMASMFQNCNALQSIDTSDWDLSSVTNITSAFNECNNLRSLDTSGWNLSSATDLTNLFQNCHWLTLSKASVDGLACSSAVTKITTMFYTCKAIRELDLSEWDLSGVSSAANAATAFRYMDNLISLTLPSTLAYIGSNCISNATVLSELHLLRTTPPTLSASSAIGGAADLKIYVPYSADHSILNAYKTATNWSSLSSQIFEEGET